MLKKEEVEKLAELSRFELNDEEIARLQSEFESILDYVSQVSEVVTDDSDPAVGTPHNVMRDDVSPHVSGEFSDCLIAAFPDSDGNYLKVKKIISQD